MLKLFSFFSAKDDQPVALAEPCPKEVGAPTVGYELLTGKGNSHYTDIILDPGHLPQLRLKGRPADDLHKALRLEYLEKAYHGITPYIHFASSLKGLAGRPDLHETLRIILLRFLRRYWDMPASADNHHAYAWGLLLHSLDVACGEAERAQSWTPMSEHGIDEIALARDLGFYVLLQFTKGLCHDAHKLYQYTMVGKNEAETVTFDPLRGQGNVLDFKMFYPVRQESWQSSIPQPGQLTSMEFLSLLPRELWGYAPQKTFLQASADLYDLVPLEADKESARRDASRTGRLTLEDLIANAIRSYFTTDKTKTNPSSHVFQVPKSIWVAVTTSQFFMKIRPLSGGVYSMDGVRSCLMAQGVVAGDDEHTGLALPFVMRVRDTEKVNTENVHLTFILASYLFEVCPEAEQIVGEIFFTEKDRAAVLEFCPDAECFLPTLPETGIGVPVQGKTTSGSGKDEAAPAKGGRPQQPKPARKGGKLGKGHAKEKPSPSPAPSTEPWEQRLQERLAAYTAADSDAEHSGWLFCDLERVLVRPPYFYAALAGADLLSKEGWGDTAKGICERLVEKGWMASETIQGSIGYLAPGGVECSITGGFFLLTLPEGEHSRLLSEIYMHSPDKQ